MLAIGCYVRIRSRAGNVGKESLLSCRLETRQSTGLISPRSGEPDPKPFQEALRKTDFYQEMKKKSGEKAWALLEGYVGNLA